MKKKVLKILAFVVAIALIIGVSVFANALVGNPISKHIATNKAEKILEDKYSDKDFEIEKIVYSFPSEYIITKHTDNRHNQTVIHQVFSTGPTKAKEDK